MWKKKAEQSEQDIAEKATFAYRSTELEIRKEAKILEEREKEEALFKTAYDAVKLGLDERTFIS